MDPQNPDLPTQFPHLQQTGDNFHYHLNIDKSISKIAGWVMGVMIGCVAVAVFSICMVIFLMFRIEDYRDQSNDTEMELRVLQDFLNDQGIKKNEQGKYEFTKEIPK